MIFRSSRRNKSMKSSVVNRRNCGIPRISWGTNWPINPWLPKNSSISKRGYKMPSRRRITKKLMSSRRKCCEQLGKRRKTCNGSRKMQLTTKCTKKWRNSTNSTKTWSRKTCQNYSSWRWWEVKRSKRLRKSTRVWNLSWGSNKILRTSFWKLR